MNIRRFAPGDEPALLKVFYSAVHQTASRDYSPEQLNAWAPPEIDRLSWQARMRTLQPFVVTSGADIVGYADVQANGYIDHFFVSGDHPRQGIGALLMNRIHQEAIRLGLSQLTADVSLTALPFFQRYAFHVIERRYPVRGGVALPNALMKKHL